VLFFLLPLVEEDDHEHGRHDEIDALSAEGQDSAEGRAHGRAGDPVDLVQQGDEEHEPALIHALGRLCRTGDGKGLVAHGEDHVGAAQAVAAVALQHGQAVKKMPCLDHQRHQKGRHRRKAAQKQRRQHEFQRAAVHYRTHQGRQPDWQAQRLHIDAVAEAQHQISGKHRQRLRRCGPERAPRRRTVQICFVLFLHLLQPSNIVV